MPFSFKNISTTFILSCLLIASFNLSAAKFYKWIDSDGNTHFSDKTPEANGDNPAEVIQVKSSSPIPSGKPADKFDLEDVEAAEKEAVKQKEAEEQEAKVQEQCKKIQANLRLLERGSRLATIDEEGERRFVDDEERQRRIKKSQEQIKQHCGG